MPQTATAPARATATEWFRSSGVQDASGGVTRYYRGDTRLPNSVEITAYAVQGMLQMGLKEQAIKAGSFILRAWNPALRAFPFELEGNQLSYFFDTGIVARALIALWRETGEDSWLNAATLAGDSMIECFAATEGYHPIVSLPGKQALPYEVWWSRNPGCFQLKAAMAWRELAELTGETRFEHHYRRQLEFSLDTAAALIEVETDPVRVMDRLHPYCYFLEGLLPVADEAGPILEHGIALVGERWRELAPQFLRSDVLAQLLRVRLISGVPLDQAAAREEAELLETFATHKGAFLFGRRAAEPIPHRNPVSTVFGFQALDWYRTGRTVSWRELI